jgi:hypothetical protein
MGLRFKIEFDVMYRSCSFEYVPPDGQGVTASSKSFDFNGYSVAALFGYCF